MPSRRFRRLELDEPKASDGPPAAPTDICRRCGTEHAEGIPTCSRCGGVLGGAGQDEFDAANRARRDLLERTATRPRLPDQHTTVSIMPAARGGASQAQPIGGRESGIASLLFAAVLTACIFALVSIPVRLAFAAADREGAPWKAFIEIGIVVVITLLVKRVAGRALASF